MSLLYHVIDRELPFFPLDFDAGQGKVKLKNHRSLLEDEEKINFSSLFQICGFCCLFFFFVCFFLLRPCPARSTHNICFYGEVR